MERVKGVDPRPKRWQRFALPLSYTRVIDKFLIENPLFFKISGLFHILNN